MPVVVRVWIRGPAARWSGSRSGPTRTNVRGGRREEEAIAAREEPAAGRLATSVGDARDVAAVGAHDELLVAGAAVARGLEGDPLSVGAEIRLGVLAAVGELAEVGQVGLPGLGGDGRAGGGRGRGGPGAEVCAFVRACVRVFGFDSVCVCIV